MRYEFLITAASLVAGGREEDELSLAVLASFAKVGRVIVSAFAIVSE
jgi:hypothetical protein